MPSLVPASSAVTLPEDSIDDLLYCARAGDLEELKSSAASISTRQTSDILSILSSAVDEITGNTCLHYAAANGHDDAVSYLTTTLSEDQQSRDAFITRPNNAGNTALHYAALNGHLQATKQLVAAVSEQERSHFVAWKNDAGHDAAFEAEGNDKESVVTYLLEVMDEADAAAAAASRSGEGDAEGDVGEEGEDGDEEEVVIAAAGEMENLSVASKPEKE